jgi:phosphate transport system substrate-binding protein
MHKLARIAAAAFLSIPLMVGARAAGTADPAISAAGSTFAAPLFKRWSERLGTERPGLKLVYESIGSGEGIERFLAGQIDLGATDAPLRPEQAVGVRQIPVTAGAIALAYNLPGVAGPLNLPRDIYPDIFLGRIARWDDPRIVAANPGLNLPAKRISLVARQDSSGTTFAFTNHLAAIAPDWAAGPGIGKSVDWPGGTMLARGNDGVAQRVKLTDGSIGYVEYGLADRLHLPMAWLENRAGGFVAPSAETGSRGLAGGSDALPDDLAAPIPDPQGARSYPIVTYTWALVRDRYEDPEKTAAVRRFLVWTVAEGQSDAEALRYIPLPANVVRAVLGEAESLGR